MANSVDPGQTAPSRAVWSGSTLFAYAILSDTLVYKILGHLLYVTFATHALKIQRRSDPIVSIEECKDVKSSKPLQELAHKLDRYRLNITGLSEMRCRNSGITLQKVNKSTSKERRTNTSKMMLDFWYTRILWTVTEYKSWDTSRSQAASLSSTWEISIIWIYTPMSSHDDNIVEEFYEELQSIIEQLPLKRHSDNSRYSRHSRLLG